MKCWLCPSILASRKIVFFYPQLWITYDEWSSFKAKLPVEGTHDQRIMNKTRGSALYLDNALITT
ncbi:MAG: hypothetical protein KA166_08310 [Saprospiraceae bacterium]|nr:hypothetical protein [Saprospiraceae bacterium]